MMSLGYISVVHACISSYLTACLCLWLCKVLDCKCRCSVWFHFCIQFVSVKETPIRLGM